MKITIVGPGAVGGLLGALLARKGEEVSFVARGEALRAIQERGLQIKGPDGDFDTGALRAEESPASLGQSDLVLVAVKSWQVEKLAPSLRPLVGPTTVIAPMQNGVEAADHLRESLGSGPVVGGVCHVISVLEGPARVAYRGLPPQVTLGELGGAISPRLQKIAAVLQNAGMVARLSENIRGDLWEKLLFVEPLGSIGAVTRVSVDVFRSLPESRELLTSAMREVENVAGNVGIRLRSDAVERAIKRIDVLPVGATASMHRDLIAGRPSELREQTGAVVRIGKRSGAKLPVHEFLWAALLPQERQARGEA
jgi:2-dehydropantoate 2-reductase